MSYLRKERKPDSGAVAAIEMRPSARSFDSPFPAPVAKWTVIIFEAQWTICVAILKLDRHAPLPQPSPYITLTLVPVFLNESI